jgi:hypothetical protein
MLGPGPLTLRERSEKAPHITLITITILGHQKQNIEKLA